MSRPPIHRSANSPRGFYHENKEDRRYFDPDFAQLISTTTSLARDDHGVEIPSKKRSLTRTLLEVPALFAHVIGEHQSLYAREAYIATAQLPDSLFRHAQKLAYEPDMGVAATGYAAFTAKEGLFGKIEKGFGLKSSPKGEDKAQIYETLASVQVDAAWNKINSIDSMISTPVDIVGGFLTLPLVKQHGLDVGEIVYLEGLGRSAVFQVEDTLEDEAEPAIRLRLMGGESAGLPWPPVDAEASDNYRLLAKPKVRTRLFGWNARADTYPPSAVSNPSLYSTPGTSTTGARFGYDISPQPDGGPAPSIGTELFLSTTIDTPTIGDPLVLVQGTDAQVFHIDSSEDRAIQFLRGEQVLLPTAPSGSGGGGGLLGVLDNFTILDIEIDGITSKTVAPVYAKQLIETSLSERVTALGLRIPLSGLPASWTAANPFPTDATVLSDWGKELEIAPLQPNPEPFDLNVTVTIDLSEVQPGRPVMLQRTDTLEVYEASIAAIIAPVSPDGDWQAVLTSVSVVLPASWTKGNTVILGNIVKISHGETKSGQIGGSDGTSPHQSFDIKKDPVTRLAGAEGAEPQLDVRVDGVLWDRVIDFHGATPEDRFYRLLTDPDNKSRAVFGGEGRGAVPPAGRRNIDAEYRIGLGKVGNTGPDRINRQIKSSPILDQVTNPLAVRGGTDPADVRLIRLQTTGPILTFGRAVSVADHANLAMQFPGVALATARWLNRGAIELIAASEVGEGVADREALLAFMNARRDDAIPLTILDPQAVDIIVSIRVERSKAYLADAVRLSVEASLIGDDDDTSPGLFTFAGRNLSAPQSLSGFYARLNKIDGVADVLAEQFALNPDPGIADILHATDRQWLRLKPNNLAIDMVEPGQLVPAVEIGAP